MHLIRLLLPLHDNNKQEFPTAYFLKVREELADRFGGVTAFLRSPAVGLWKEDANKVSRDDMVMFEVMSNQLCLAFLNVRGAMKNRPQETKT